MPPQMMPPQGMPPAPPSGFLAAAQQQAQSGAMPSAGNAPPPGGISPPLPQPGMPPQGAMPPQGPPPQSGPPMPPDPAMQTQIFMHFMQTMSPQAKQAIIQQLTQSLGAQGRNGDSMIVHQTPGEINVPPAVQSKEVLATLNKAFNKVGVPAHQYMAGSPSQNINPNTGLPEFGLLPTNLLPKNMFSGGFMKAALPIALGVGGSLLLPGIGSALGASAGGALAGGAAADTAASTIAGGALAGGAGAATGAAAGTGAGAALGAGAGAAGGAAAGTAGAAGAGTLAAGTAAPSSLALSSLGSGLGTTTGGLLTGQRPGQAIGAGLGAGLGGYALGNLSQGLSAMGSPSGSPAQPAMPGLFGGSSAQAAVPPSEPWANSGVAINGAANPAPTVFGHAFNPYQVGGGSVGGLAGGYLGGQITKPAPGPNLPPGFNSPYTPGVGSWQDQLGQTNYAGPYPNYNNFNPATNFPAAHNFYPTS